jgi:predicted PurR-regulated permease PerM
MSTEQRLLLVAIALFGVLAVLMVLPYEQYLLLAILLAYLLHPLQHRLRSSVGPRVSAGLLIIGVFLAVIVPLGVFVRAAVRQAISILTAINRGDVGVGALENFLGQQVGISIDLQRLLLRSGFDASTALGGAGGGNTTTLLNNATRVVTNLVSVFGRVTDIAIGLMVLLFVLYYLLVDGPALVSWLRTVSPFRVSTFDRLYDRIDRLMYAVLFGNLLVGIVQGVLVGIGFAILGVPNAIFWTIVTAVLSLLPVIGAFIVWVPAVGYLFVIDRPVIAVVLLAYGTLVVSLSDNYLRPVIGGREAQLNPGVFIVGIFGGLAVFGFMGVFFGPVVLGLLIVLVEIFAEYRNPVGPAR